MEPVKRLFFGRRGGRGSGLRPDGPAPPERAHPADTGFAGSICLDHMPRRPDDPGLLQSYAFGYGT
jgi:hypothetical protein